MKSDAPDFPDLVIVDRRVFSHPFKLIERSIYIEITIEKLDSTASRVAGHSAVPDFISCVRSFVGYCLLRKVVVRRKGRPSKDSRIGTGRDLLLH